MVSTVMVSRMRKNITAAVEARSMRKSTIA